MELITIKTFDNAIDLHIVKVRLESEGITCFVFDENIVSVNPLYNITVGGIKLKVREEDIEHSLAILKEIEATPLTTEENQPIVCPNCSSTNVESGHRSLSGLKGILSGIVSFFFMLFPIYFNRTYHCRNCETNFENPKNQ
jgi:hypothetical protein